MTAAAGSPRTLARVGIVGRGRVGSCLAARLREAGYEVEGPLGRGEATEAEVVLLCVPDAEIEAAARALPEGARFVGHTSGVTPVSVLGKEAFGLHPLQTITGPETRLEGVGCAIGGPAGGVARELAEALGMHPFELHDEQRPAYHAAASIASNYLLALEATAEGVAAGAGIGPEDARRLLGPLVRQTVENWVAHGPASALTGPVARGDEATVARQREAIRAACPEALELFDALTERTRALARRAVTA
jgi:predicted short-subunit dehydrogenase-like oxidoreductase (DUF2520 family)